MGSGREVGGEIQKVVVSGERSGIDSPAYVYLPPEYFRPENAQRTFPAAVVLTGYPGTAENLLKGLRYPRTAYEQVKAGEDAADGAGDAAAYRGAAAGHGVRGRAGRAADGDVLSRSDLPEAVSEAYRVGSAPRNWGFIGNSTGGYCALKIALHHPERFAVGAGLSAYYKAAEDVTTGDLFRGDDALRKRSDLLWSLDNVPLGKSSFLVASSRQGEGEPEGDAGVHREGEVPRTGLVDHAGQRGPQLRHVEPGDPAGAGVDERPPQRGVTAGASARTESRRASWSRSGVRTPR